jgi:hypothetical protein
MTHIPVVGICMQGTTLKQSPVTQFMEDPSCEANMEEILQEAGACLRHAAMRHAASSAPCRLFRSDTMKRDQGGRDG